MSEEFQKAKNDMTALVGSVRSVMLATSTSKGTPHVSYAPVYVDEKLNMYVFLSQMAKHYGLMKNTGSASAMFIEDEGGVEKLFARKRLTFECSAELIARESEEWTARIDAMVLSLGDTMAYLKDMLDFDLFRLSPNSGRLVLGFGQAFQISGDDLENLGYVQGSGHIRKAD